MNSNTQTEKTDVIVSLDIGSSKIVALAAELSAVGEIKLLGQGTYFYKDSSIRGIKKGMVVNIEATVKAISKAIEELEIMANCQVNEVFSGISGTHIQCQDSNGMAVVQNKEITDSDLAYAMQAANATRISSDETILHTIVQDFIIDGQVGVRDPIGMDAKRLEVRVHIITGTNTAIQNIQKCIHRCGLTVPQLILQPLASSYAALTDDEKDVGVCLVDIGAGTTEVAIFENGALQHTAIIPIAGDQITSDIGVALRVSTKDAEGIKIKNGVALQQIAAIDEEVLAPGIGDRKSRLISRQTLAGFIQPRIEEIYRLVDREIKECKKPLNLRAGIVITGGSALMPGMVPLGEEIFHNTVKIGIPTYKGHLDDMVCTPQHAAAMGLLMMAVREERQIKASNKIDMKVFFKRTIEWVRRNF